MKLYTIKYNCTYYTNMSFSNEIWKNDKKIIMVINTNEQYIDNFLVKSSLINLCGKYSYIGLNEENIINDRLGTSGYFVFDDINLFEDCMKHLQKIKKKIELKSLSG